ncbi:hypothetical protein Rhopal_007783-T1 [Rhodotorula paludigena]|uniref:Rho-GAP domain-containing protein n=1 Tax=Rhodotorula paludigena TaxID=86838 RepID=A0AAV5GZ93_9BASI|nr:hypothetical protein Rhopal_007783-T1 [Rhodotorula paludigena]
MREDEAAVLVLRGSGGPASSLVVVVERVLPVCEAFELAIEQTDAGLAAQGHTEFRISLSSPPLSSPTTPSFAFLADSLSDRVTAFLAQLRDAHKLAQDRALSPSCGSHEWARAYAHLDERGGAGTGVGGVEASGPFDSYVSAEDLRLERTREEEAAAERWIAERLKEREDEFLRKEEIRVWCGTFNVNDKQPKNGASDIQAWVDSCDGAELLVFSFQELDLSTEAMLRYTPYREEVWRTALEAALRTRTDVSYEKLHSRQLVGALMLVYVREDVKHRVSDVSSASMATGLLGLVANKGVVGVRLRYRDAPLTFLNSHLAAFVQNTAQRNAQFRDTAAQLVFPRSSSSSTGAVAEGWTPDLRPGKSTPAGEGWSVWECEALVWMGDLNYRVDLPRADVDRMVKNKEHELLLHFDQLRIQKQHGLAFQDFEEAPITFPPSFKFDVGTQIYDTSEKQRVPSWTDRILYLGMRRDSVRVLDNTYTSHPNVTMSDHKPVSAMLAVSVYDVVAEKRKEVEQEIMAELDRFDNDALPDVKLAPGPSVDFDVVRYDEPVTSEIEVVNCGAVPAAWSFVVKPGTTDLFPSWLHVSPASGLVLPGQRQTVSLAIHVTASSAAALNFPSTKSKGELADLLVLSVRGKDLFLSVAAKEWVPTVFGSRLDHLVYLSSPIRATSLEQRSRVARAVEAARAGTTLEDEDGERLEKQSVPEALQRLIGFLGEHALGVSDLFGTPGDVELVELARECLDTGDDFPLDRFLPEQPARAAPSSPPDAVDALASPPVDTSHLEADLGSFSLSSPNPDSAPASPPRSPALSAARGSDELDAATVVGLHSLAGCTLLWLESLAEPVVSWERYEEALRCEQREDAFRVVKALSEAHANTLLYILAFLRILLSQTADADERAAQRDRLAVIFSTVLLRAPPASWVSSRAHTQGAAPAQKQELEASTVPRRKKTFVLLLLLDECEEGVGAARQIA